MGQRETRRSEMVFLRVTTEPLVGYRLKMRAAVVSWRVRRLRAAAHRKARHVARARNLTLRLWLTALLAVLAGLSAASPAMAETVTFTDTTVSDFSAGSLDANTFISQTEDGEVILMPTVGAEFSNSSLPEHWSSCNWSGNDCVTPGSGATVSGGSLHVLGAMASTEATFAPGRSLEFVATFGSAAFQHVGFSDNFQNSVGDVQHQQTPTGQLYTRTNGGLDPGHRDRHARPVRRLPASLPDPVGSGRRSSTSSTETSVHTDISVAREQPQRRRQRLQLGRPRRSRSTGCT